MEANSNPTTVKSPTSAPVVEQPTVKEQKPTLPKILTAGAAPVDTLNILVYGPPGVGKTVFAGSTEDVAAARDVLFLDVEAGTMSIRDRKFLIGHATTWNELKEVVNWFLSDPGAKKIKTVCIDSLTEVVKLATAQVIQDDMMRNPTRDVDLSTLQDWQRTILRVSRMVQLLRDAGVNFVATALAAELKDELSGAVIKKPALPGKLSDEIPGYFDVVGYLYIDTTDKNNGAKRMLRVDPTYNILAKDRSSKLGSVVSEPTFSKVYDAIFGGK